MLKLTPNDIRLSAAADSKVEAIVQIVDQMVADGLVDSAYLQGMLDREEQTSTYLGNGIAIPHGTTETRDLVKETGLKVFRFPEGIEWGKDQIVYTAVGIAAKSDEHLAILRQLTRVIGDEALSKKLHTTKNPNEVKSILTGEALAGEFLMNAEMVRMNAAVASYAECISLAGAILWTNKAVQQQELTDLYAKPPFHLGQDVWLASLHTTAQNGGVSIVKPEHPISLYGEQLQLLMAITTNSSSHWPLLEKLAELKASNALKDLTNSKRAVDVIRLLVAQELAGKQTVCRLAMPHGLHARPAANLARLAKDFSAEIWVENLDGDSPAVSALSVTKLISLGGLLGHRLQLTANGEDAEAALTQLSDAIAGGLGDSVIQLTDDAAAAPKTAETHELEPLAAGDELFGLTGAPGVAIAPAYQASEQSFEFDRKKGPAQDETARLSQAVIKVSEELKARLDKATNTELAQIIAMHLELLDDPEMQQDAEKHIQSGDSAEWGWQQSFETLASAQEKSTELLLAERAIDIRDVGNRVLAVLTGQDTANAIKVEHVLVCQEIAPSEISELDTEKVKAVVTAAGGVTSHAAILARSLGIPLLVGCGARVLTVNDGTNVIVDCEGKSIKIAPSEEALQTAREAIVREREINARAHATRMEPAVTTDGHQVEVMANLTASKAVEKAVDLGCEGVGLFRSEFIYMDYPQEPSIEQQREEYARVLDSLSDKPLIVRTLDVGGDKPLPYMPIDEEENPFLGIRGVRLSLRYPKTLENQLHALLQAADGRQLRIMFPMVTDIQEWRQIKAIYQKVAANYPNAKVELGIMIEVPSAALQAHVFAKELDFFSVGTNDLTQYTLAIDRGHPELSRQADSISPAVLRLIDVTVKAAKEHGIWVGVCGELAADPLGAAILTGIGVRELSMSVRAIPRIKAHLRELSLTQAKQLATQALAAESSEAVRQLTAEAI